MIGVSGTARRWNQFHRATEENLMTTRLRTPLNRLFVLSGFLAVPVVAIILISIARPDPMIVKGLLDLTVAYLVWRAATDKKAPHECDGQKPA
jgi:hypothetical protein